MIKIVFFFLLFLFTSCGKPKSVFICGDHICVNKTEAKQFFEENLTIEVKIINKKKTNTVDLVQLNLNRDYNDGRKISVQKKKRLSSKIKKLSEKEKNLIKAKVKKKKSREKYVMKNLKKTQNTKKKENIENTKIKDVCIIIEKCSIEEISKYLIKVGKNKQYPDITFRN